MTNNTDKPLVIFHRPVICCDDGMCPEDFIELADKMAWCQSVGLDISTLRLQPYSYYKFKFTRDAIDYANRKTDSKSIA